jgi:endonuclease-3 related protein
MSTAYGPQGWWPVRGERRHFNVRAGELGLRGYHPGQFDFPRTRNGRWEIICGAVLTQNTAWTNVERALDALRASRLMTAKAVLQADREQLSSVIRPAGYFNQKAGYLVAVAQWFLEHDRALSQSASSREHVLAFRPGLLKVLGIGPETADSILLYAYRLPTFVIDAYTRRVFGRIGVVGSDWKYEQIRALFESALDTPDPIAKVIEWQEAHALIVAHAKRFHARTSVADADFLLRLVG